MKTINGVEFLTPQEAGEKLAVNPKTLQRWTDAGERWTWIYARTNGNGTGTGNGNGNGNGHRYQRVKERRPVNVEFQFTRAGHRLYHRGSIDALLNELRKEEKQQHLLKPKQEKSSLRKAA